MPRYSSLRITALLVLVAMLLSVPSVAWAAPTATASRSVPAVPTPSRGANGIAGTQRGIDRATNTQPSAQPAASMQGFSEEERAKLQTKDQKSDDLKKYKGGEVIIIGSSVLLIVLVIVLVVILVD